MNAYRITCRPAWAENVPAGFTSLTASDAPGYNNYGTVEYAERLPRHIVEHYSLRPVGYFKLPSIRHDGEVQPLAVVFGSLSDIAWEFAEGIVSKEALETHIKTLAASYGVEDEIEIIWPEAEAA